MAMRVGVTVPLNDALQWSRDSLDRGEGAFASELCQAMTGELDKFSHARLLVGEEQRELGQAISATGMGLSRAKSQDLAAAAIVELRSVGAKSMIVENDLAERGDVFVGPDCVFVGARVEHWMSIDDDRAAAGLLRTANYPLNAFFSTSTPAALGLSAGATLSGGEVSGITASTIAIVHQVFDDETYLILTRE